MPQKISVKVLSDFMLAASARQRTLVKDSKFPKLKDGKPKPQIVRYSVARAAIRDYHESGNDVNVLISAVEKLSKTKTEKGDKAGRIGDNIRAIKAYMEHFSKKEFKVLKTPKPMYAFDQMLVSTTPDLFVEEKGTRKLIKLDFNQVKPNEDGIDIILKVMYEAAAAELLGVKPKDVIYLDVSRQKQYDGAKLNKKLKKDIDAALATIQDMWPAIKES
jgi:hypothetical protein